MGRATGAVSPGIDRQPSSIVSVVGSSTVICGLITACGGIAGYF